MTLYINSGTKGVLQGNTYTAFCIYSGLKKRGSYERNKREINGRIMFVSLYLFLFSGGFSPVFHFIVVSPNRVKVKT